MFTRTLVASRADYQQLVYSAIGANSRRKIRLLPPCIRKPKELWSGKQVSLVAEHVSRIRILLQIISTILLYIQPVKETALNLDSKSKLSMKVRHAWRISRSLDFFL